MRTMGLLILGLVAWWAAATLTWGLGSQGLDLTAIPYVLFFGSFYAIPSVIYVAIAHAYATTRRKPLVVFLTLAVAGIAALCAFVQFGPGHPSNKPFYTVQSARFFFTGIGIPTLALIAVYAMDVANRAGKGLLPPYN
jgi:hypothetical protein